jgi:hypothetical protein
MYQTPEPSFFVLPINAEQRALVIARDGRSLDIGVRIFFELLMAGHFIYLAVFFAEEQPPSVFFCEK